MLIDEKEALQNLIRQHIVLLADLNDTEKTASKLKDEVNECLVKLEAKLNAD